MKKEEQNRLPENQLENVAGGIYDPNANKPGYFEYPALLDTDDKVQDFASNAAGSQSTVSVRNRGGQSCDGKDAGALLALDRSGTVTVTIFGMWDDPFRSYAMKFSPC